MNTADTDLTPEEMARITLGAGTALRLLQAATRGEEDTFQQIITNCDQVPVISALVSAWLTLARATRTNTEHAFEAMRTNLPDEDEALAVLARKQTSS